MSTDFESALELYQLAQSKGLRIGQAPDTFLGGALQTARNLIDKGFIGEPVNAQAMVARCYNLTQDNGKHKTCPRIKPFLPCRLFSPQEEAFPTIWAAITCMR